MRGGANAPTLSPQAGREGRRAVDLLLTGHGPFSRLRGEGGRGPDEGAQLIHTPAFPQLPRRANPAHMPLHLIKLCVGEDSVAGLEEWVDERVRERIARGEAPRSRHITRMVPSRAAEIVGGGSLYWIIKGQLAARQRILEIEKFVDVDGIGRCRLWLDREVVKVTPRPMRPFQGWRYFADKDAPPDLGAFGAAQMPEPLRRALGELGLL